MWGGKLSRMRAAIEEREVGVAVQLDVRFQADLATSRSQAANFGDCQLFACPLPFSTAPKETFEGSGTSRKAGAGASEAVHRGHFFFWNLRLTNQS